MELCPESSLCVCVVVRQVTHFGQSHSSASRLRYDLTVPTTLILGAGPAGMAAAMELHRGGRSVHVVERTEAVGGLAKTLEFRQPDGVYRTDIGPHRFFSKNQYLYGFIADLLGEEWREVPRLTRFCIDGQFYLYPIQFADVLKKMGVRRALAVLRDYLWERARAMVHPRRVDSFEAYCLTTFGRTLAEFNMLNYTQKIWGLPCSQISVDWATQRIGGLSIVATIKKMLFKHGGPKSLVDSFYYPQHGSGTIYEAIRRRLLDAGQTFQFSAQPSRITWSGNRVTGVEITDAAGCTMHDPAQVVCSVPASEVVKLFDPPPPPEVLQAAAGLRFRAQRYVFLTLNRASVSRDNWIYFPDANIPFGRIAEMKNFSADLCPAGKTSLFVEYFCFSSDAIWNMSDDELGQLTIGWLEKLGLITATDVLSRHYYKLEHVYPVYDLQYGERLRTLMAWLDRFDNFFAVGRPGRFRYTNQDHSLEMGILAARSIIDGKRYKVDEVGAEKEYFERGYVPTQR